MAFDMLIGSDELRARLAGDVLEGTLSHAYILEGARGSGKRTLSQAIAAALACERRDARALPCTECPACRKVLEGKSPDVIRVARQKDKASIGVDDVRYLRSDVLIPPNDLENKIYIIEQADLMTEQACCSCFCVSERRLCLRPFAPVRPSSVFARYRSGVWRHICVRWIDPLLPWMRSSKSRSCCSATAAWDEPWSF